MNQMNTLDCMDVKALLSALVDDEVDGDTRHQAERHLAGCDECRQLIDDAESLDGVLLMDAADLAPTELSEAFEAAVLARTVYAGRGASMNRWTTWTGWLAAAACLTLAATLWVQERGPFSDSSTPDTVVTTTDSSRSWSSRNEMRSDVYDGSMVSGDVFSPTPAPQFDPTVSNIKTAYPTATTSSLNWIDDEPTLLSTAMLLTLLDDATDDETIEYMREIISYDEVIARLAEVRDRVAPAERAVIQDTLLVLERLMNPDIRDEDIEALRALSTNRGLHRRIDGMLSRMTEGAV